MVANRLFTEFFEFRSIEWYRLRARSVASLADG